MILSHRGKTPVLDPSPTWPRNATLCGDVTVGAGSRIMFGACAIAEGKPITLGKNSIVMENAVIRSTDDHAAAVGDHCLIGPQAHLVGCVLEDCVFIATGATSPAWGTPGLQPRGTREWGRALADRITPSRGGSHRLGCGWHAGANIAHGST